MPFERLTREHDRAAFTCGTDEKEEEMNGFLRTKAIQNADKNLSRTYVLVNPDRPRVDPAKKPIDGFYTLTSHSIRFEDVPDNLPAYPVPVIHLARLAVHTALKGQGISRKVIIDSFRRCYRISEEIGVYAVELIASRDELQGFYTHMEFKPLLDNPSHFYYPMKTIKKLLIESGLITAA